MRLDEVTAEIRPRSDWEAVDLGFALVRRDFWRCLTVWWLAVLLPTLVLGWFCRSQPLLLMVAFWWWKPAGSRMVLFELSRRLFGERPRWGSVWREIPRVWTKRFFYRFILARLSPWMPVTLAVDGLEGLKGKAYRQRASQVTRRGDGIITSIYLSSDLVSIYLAAALMMLAGMFLPEGRDSPWTLAVETWSIDAPLDIPLVLLWMVTVCMMISISLVDLFLIGAGFGIYLNNRTWLEGWDVELAFRRLGQRLGKVAVVLLALLCLASPGTARAEADKPPGEVIREVLASPDFTVHKQKHKVPRSNTSSRPAPGWLAAVAQIVGWVLGLVAVVVLLGFAGWMIWQYRHLFRIGAGGKAEGKILPAARVVMGMEVTAESLPGDVPSAALLLWQQGRHQEALGLLYRGAISKTIDLGRVEIQESDTEGDCLRRVEEAGANVHPGYFRGLTSIWMGLAYGGRVPADGEVRALCGEWPYLKGGRA